ncbi:MAG TPA: hypothetical protein ENG28_01645 [Deltaproteobacteria bacterium]|nr:hypothetical protein [Deltaproteobacteria bacterium]
MIIKIISGGQTKSHQAALDVAIALNIPHGRWIAKGRLRASHGQISLCAVSSSKPLCSKTLSWLRWWYII